MFHMRDEAGGDDKILCIPAGDPRKAHIAELSDVTEFDQLEIQHFFETYKDLEPGKSVEGAHWAGREEAEACIREALERREGRRPHDRALALPVARAEGMAEDAVTSAHTPEELLEAAEKARAELATKDKPLSDG